MVDRDREEGHTEPPALMWRNSLPSVLVVGVYRPMFSSVVPSNHHQYGTCPVAEERIGRIGHGSRPTSCQLRLRCRWFVDATSIVLQATSKAYMKPQHAAAKSNAKAFFRPSFAQDNGSCRRASIVRSRGGDGTASILPGSAPVFIRSLAACAPLHRMPETFLRENAALLMPGNPLVAGIPLIQFFVAENIRARNL